MSNTNPHAAAQRVITAWTDEGPNPEHHYRMQAALRVNWPTLADAVEALVDDAVMLDYHPRAERRRWVLLRQQKQPGDVYGKLEAVDADRYPTMEAALQHVFGDGPPVDARCHRVLVLQVVGGMALPIVVEPPKWPRQHQVEPTLGGLAPWA